MEFARSPLETDPDTLQPELYFSQPHNIALGRMFADELETVELAYSQAHDNFYVRGKGSDQMMYKHFSHDEVVKRDSGFQEEGLYAAFNLEEAFPLEGMHDVQEEILTRNLFKGVVEATLAVLRTAEVDKDTYKFATASRDLMRVLQTANQPLLTYRNMVLRKGRNFAPEYARMYRRLKVVGTGLDIEDVMGMVGISVIDPPQTISHLNAPSSVPETLISPDEIEPEEPLFDEPVTKTDHFLRMCTNKATGEQDSIAYIAGKVADGEGAAVLPAITKDSRPDRERLAITAYFDLLSRITAHKVAAGIYNKLAEPGAPLIRAVELANFFTDMSNRRTQDKNKHVLPLELHVTNVDRAFHRLRYVMRQLGLESEQTAEQMGYIVQSYLGMNAGRKAGK